MAPAPKRLLERNYIFKLFHSTLNVFIEYDKTCLNAALIKPLFFLFLFSYFKKIKQIIDGKGNQSKTWNFRTFGIEWLSIEMCVQPF